MSKGGLGRGLGALIPNSLITEEKEELKQIESKVEKKNSQELLLNQIIPNDEQPRKVFDDDKLMDLQMSIKEHGLLQPIIVCPKGDKYLIVAGERRYRACKNLDLEKVPVIIKELSDNEILEIALIENIQRDDLNPIEEAKAYKTLMEKHKFTQEKIAQRVGKSRSFIANFLRLLALPEEVLYFVEENLLTVGHVRPLLAIEDPQLQVGLAHEIYENRLSVREVEKLIKELETPEVKIPSQKIIKSPEMKTIEEQLKVHFGTKVSIKNKGEKGKIEIEYYNKEDLKRVIDAFGIDLY